MRAKSTSALLDEADGEGDDEVVEEGEDDCESDFSVGEGVESKTMPFDVASDGWTVDCEA